MSVCPNPSHLEAVNPVVEGIVRAKQNRHKPEGRDSSFLFSSTVMPPLRDKGSWPRPSTSLNWMDIVRMARFT